VYGVDSVLLLWRRGNGVYYEKCLLKNCDDEVLGGDESTSYPEYTSIITIFSVFGTSLTENFDGKNYVDEYDMTGWGTSYLNCPTVISWKENENNVMSGSSVSRRKTYYECFIYSLNKFLFDLWWCPEGGSMTGNFPNVTVSNEGLPNVFRRIFWEKWTRIIFLNPEKTYSRP
jgi:hypothetical protein